MEQKAQSNYNLRDVLTILFKHKYKILIVFFSVLVVALITALSVPTYYASRSVIMVKYGREYVPVAESSEMKFPLVSADYILNTEVQIMTSHDLLSAVVNSMGVQALFPDLKQTRTDLLIQAATARLGQNLVVKPIPSSNTIEVYLRHRNPYVAQKTLNILMTLFNDKHLKVFAGSKSSFLEDQVKIYENRLRDSEAKLAQFKDQYEITSIKDQFWWVVGKRTDLLSGLKTEQTRLNEIREKLAFLKNQKRQVIQDLYTDTTRTTLTNLEAKETALLQTYKENSRPIKNVRKEIETVRESLRQYEEAHKQSAEWVSVAAELAPQQLKITGLKDQVAGLDKQLQQLTMAGEELNRLEREVTLNQNNYETYVKKYEEARISEDMDKRKMTNIQMIEPPSLPIAALRANQQKIIGVGLFLAIALSLGLAFLCEFIPEGSTTPQVAQRHLRLPILVAITHKGPGA